ncbi:MAG: hypothetical protein RR343_06215, partial [Oscillospiraceae bacterium]
KNTWVFAKKHKLKLVLYFVTTMALSTIGAIVPILSAKLLLNMTNGLTKAFCTTMVSLQKLLNS